MLFYVRTSLVAIDNPQGLFAVATCWEPMGMRWEESVFALFDDLEMQAEGLYLEHRVGEVESLAEAGYAEVLLASRVQASPGAPVRLALLDGTEIRGRLARSGAGWVLVDSGASEWLVQLDAVTLVEGLSGSSLPRELWPMVARLSVRSALRRIAGVDGSCVVWLADGRQVTGTLGRVGADFVELGTPSAPVVIPTAAIAAVQGAR